MVKIDCIVLVIGLLTSIKMYFVVADVLIGRQCLLLVHIVVHWLPQSSFLSVLIYTCRLAQQHCPSMAAAVHLTGGMSGHVSEHL